MHLSTLLLFLNPWKGLCYPSFSGVFGAVLLHYLQNYGNVAGFLKKKALNELNLLVERCCLKIIC